MRAGTLPCTAIPYQCCKWMRSSPETLFCSWCWDEFLLQVLDYQITTPGLNSRGLCRIAVLVQQHYSRRHARNVLDRQARNFISVLIDEPSKLGAGVQSSEVELKSAAMKRRDLRGTSFVSGVVPAYSTALLAFIVKSWQVCVLQKYRTVRTTSHGRVEP